MRKLIFFAISIVLILWGCTSSDGTGNFKLYLTDQPIDADQILVTISEINVQKEGEGFVTICSVEKIYDLLKLRSQEEMIADVTLNEGKYTQIRLVVTKGKIVIHGKISAMTVASSEVKIPFVFNVMEDGATEIVLDFEADESIHVVYAGQSEKYILTPVIKVKSIGY